MRCWPAEVNEDGLEWGGAELHAFAGDEDPHAEIRTGGRRYRRCTLAGTEAWMQHSYGLHAPEGKMVVEEVREEAGRKLRMQLRVGGRLHVVEGVMCYEVPFVSESAPGVAAFREEAGVSVGSDTRVGVHRSRDSVLCFPVHAVDRSGEPFWGGKPNGRLFLPNILEAVAPSAASMMDEEGNPLPAAEAVTIDLSRSSRTMVFVKGRGDRHLRWAEVAKEGEALGEANERKMRLLKALPRLHRRPVDSETPCLTEEHVQALFYLFAVSLLPLSPLDKAKRGQTKQLLDRASLAARHARHADDVERIVRTEASGRREKLLRDLPLTEPETEEEKEEEGGEGEEDAGAEDAKSTSAAPVERDDFRFRDVAPRSKTDTIRRMQLAKRGSGVARAMGEAALAYVRDQPQLPLAPPLQDASPCGPSETKLEVWRAVQSAAAQGVSLFVRPPVGSHSDAGRKLYSALCADLFDRTGWDALDWSGGLNALASPCPVYAFVVRQAGQPLRRFFGKILAFKLDGSRAASKFGAPWHTATTGRPFLETPLPSAGETVELRLSDLLVFDFLGPAIEVEGDIRDVLLRPPVLQLIRGKVRAEGRRVLLEYDIAPTISRLCPSSFESASSKCSGQVEVTAPANRDAEDWLTSPACRLALEKLLARAVRPHLRSHGRVSRQCSPDGKLTTYVLTPIPMHHKAARIEVSLSSLFRAFPPHRHSDALPLLSLQVEVLESKA